MASQLSHYDSDTKLRELRDRGWCAFEEVYNDKEIGHMLSLLHSQIDGLDPARLSGFGATIFALAARDPEMRSYAEGAIVNPFIERAMDGPFNLRRSGARISSRTSQERIIWHHHHGWTEQDLTARNSFDRLHFICYLNGTERDAGPLIVKPRALTDPFESEPEKRFEAIDGEYSVEYPPGTIIVMDAPILHSAWRSRTDQLRTIWGCHVQSASNDAPHPDDDVSFEKTRVKFRHKVFRMGWRNSRAWVERANRSPLPKTSGY